MSKSYRDLDIWKKSFSLAKKVYAFCKLLPSDEKYGLVSQIQRSAVSVPSNIAEGQQRGSDKEFKRFLLITKGSLAELSTQLLLAGEIYSLEVSELNESVEELQKMVHGLIKKL